MVCLAVLAVAAAESEGAAPAVEPDGESSLPPQPTAPSNKVRDKTIPVPSLIVLIYIDRPIV
ncbi:hypothetical protein D3C73_1652400 [compost metagenome]